MFYPSAMYIILLQTRWDVQIFLSAYLNKHIITYYKANKEYTNKG